MAGTGVVLRNSKGDVLMLLSKQVRIKESEEAEVMEFLGSSLYMMFSHNNVAVE